MKSTIKTFILLIALLATVQIASAGDLFVDKELAEAKASAKQSNKWVMIDFMAEWCGPCKLLDRTTWSDEKVKSTLGDKVIAIKIDVDERRDIAMDFRIQAMPTIVFLDSGGKEVGRFVGYKDAEGFLEAFAKL